MLIQLPKTHSQILVQEDENLKILSNFILPNQYSSAIIVSDTEVFPLYGSTLINQLQRLHFKTIIPFVLASGEGSKNFNTAQACWQQMYEAKADRRSILITLGGGVVSDLGGFIAANYMRGIDLIHIPTTLLGMVDASIGGKNGINIEGGKNIIGSVHAPRAVLVSAHFLKSLPEREYNAGFAEVVKYGAIVDRGLFKSLEQAISQISKRDPVFLNQIITSCCQIKADIVEQDENEHGMRVLLNFGHTFAHAIETGTGYSKYLHGEAVAIGMSCAFYLSKALGFIEQECINQLHRLLGDLQLPIHLPTEPNAEALMKLMYGDKKTVNGQLNLITLHELGQAKLIKNVDPAIILKILKSKIEEKA